MSLVNGSMVASAMVPPATGMRCRMTDKTAMAIIMHVVTPIISAAIAATEKINIRASIHRNHPTAAIAHVADTPGQAPK